MPIGTTWNAASSNGVDGRRLRSAAACGSGKKSCLLRSFSTVTSGLFQSSSEMLNDPAAERPRPCAATTKSETSPEGRTRQMDCVMPTASLSHCSASCAASAISARPTKPSRRRTRAASCSASSPGVSSTATRTRGTPVYGAEPLRFVAGCRAPLTATSAAGGRASLELSPEGGVFSNDFLIPLALDRGLRHWSDLADRFPVLQVRLDRCDDDARFHGDQVDTDQRNANPCVDDYPLVEYSIEDVDETCAACGSFNGHRTLLASRLRAVFLPQ